MQYDDGYKKSLQLVPYSL